MAEVKDLEKLTRAQLNDLATSKGVEDAANEEKYVTKADLIKDLQPLVTPEEVEAARTGEKVEGADKGEQTPPEQEGEGNEDEGGEEPSNSPEPTPPVDQPTPPPIDSADDVDDQSGTEKLPTKQEEDEPVEDEKQDYPTVAGAPPVDSVGMGFKVNKDGQTVDIFDGKTVHTHVRNVAGVMVPLSQKSYETKTDAEIIEKLKKLGKL